MGLWVFFAEMRLSPVPGEEEEMLWAVICTEGILMLRL